MASLDHNGLSWHHSYDSMLVDKDFSNHAWKHQATTWPNFDFSLVLRHSPENNFVGSIQAAIMYSEFENHISDIIATSPRRQSIKQPSHSQNNVKHSIIQSSMMHDYSPKFKFQWFSETNTHSFM